MSTHYDPEIDSLIVKVVEAGSHYRMEEMEALYTPDQSLLLVAGDKTVTRFPRSAMMAEFAARGAAGDPPLSTERNVLHIEQQGDYATAIIHRRMSESAPVAMYELRLRKENGRWQVAGETVTGWPREEDSGDFLPRRATNR